MDTTILAAVLAGLFALIAAIVGALVASEKLILTDFFRWRRQLPPGFIVIINGASGVGKTSIAWALSRKYNVPTVFSSDLIRESLRCCIPNISDIEYAVLLRSSFLAHQQVKMGVEANVVEGFKAQCGFMLKPILGVCNRIRGKRDPAIIEGVNIVASQVFSQIPNDPLNRILFVNLYIESEEVHKNRLRQRGKKSGEPGAYTDRYIRNIEAIREIDRYLKEDSLPMTTGHGDSVSNVISIENSGPLSSAVNRIDKHIKAKLKTLNRSGA